MPKTTTCGATVDLADERTLTCVLPKGHDGPVHEDQHGEQWGGDQPLISDAHADETPAIDE